MSYEVYYKAAALTCAVSTLSTLMLTVMLPMVYYRADNDRQVKLFFA